MKKFVVGTALTALVLAGCGNGGASEEESATLRVGASNVPHAEILEKAKPMLEEQGIDLEIETYQDYILPNKDLESGEIDANYFQTVPYLETQIADNGYEFENAGGIHIEPIGVYSQKYASLDELPQDATILMSNSVSEQGRILSLLEVEGLITLAEGVDKTSAEVSDIVDNPKNLQLEPDYEAALLVQLYESGEGDAVLINSNYAIDAGISPLEDSIAIESSDSPYVNIITVRAGDEDNENVKALVEVLKSQEIQDFILEEWGGSVVPVD
ncbi:Methionine ABC transporter substrate-binding protein [Planococcus halocryophilus Or1]|uniref:Lipoprotein n=1 Tax=Planococcus halocryophilus TaxID=1215089 RepID=A0A1C7DM78_9BACL|nr:MetQ/NlpA family ABC transporter substrate-binding protein [Planococcus halocryophilus]ANU12565.1 methionine ABC transporter substrate-binding protein [Planococcus halocryophilus]EMF46679.1 Methionine ABC transporter substrate-binding protein [Planococcus halocryophilus Or1]